MSLFSKVKLAVKKPPRHTFSSALPNFKNHYKNSVSENTIRDFGWAWKQLDPFFGEKQIDQITPDQVEAYKAKRISDGVEKKTINRELCYLSNIIKWAENNHLIGPFPFRIKKFRRRDTRSPIPTVHTVEEISRIIDHVHPRRLGLVLLMYDAGLRKTEACTLRGAQVDIDRRQICVLGKGNKERIVPILTQRLLNELKKAKAETGGGYLYINPKTGLPFKSITTHLRTASRRAGVDKKIYHHILRHDHGTHTAIAGVDCRAIQRMLGHSDLSTTEIYTHLAGDYLQSEGSKFADLIERE